MESRTAWSPGSREALEAVAASVSFLAACTGGGAHRLDPPDAGLSPDANPLRELADGCLDGLAALARLEARTAALKVRLAAEYVQATRALASPELSAQERTTAAMVLVAEVACVLTISERTAGAFLSECQALTTTLPLTLTALQAGMISWQHARILVEETAGLDPPAAAGLEAHFLDPGAANPARGCPAGELVASRFRAKARSWRERHHGVSIEKRHTKSAADRRVEYLPDRDGMAWLSAYLPADTAAGIWERTTAAARALQRPDETRPLSQLRADVAATWLLTSHTTGTCTGAGGGVPSPRAQVLITVPVLSLLGATDEPATLDGYGPIPPSMARRLVADGADSYHRVLTDPRNGAPLEIGRTSYRVTKAQRQWLRLRDGRCPFPGCNNQSLDNEADHLLAWAEGGTTGISNLGQPCPKHHRLKHRSSWTPTKASQDNPPGWTSPSRRQYASEHQDWEPPHLPDPIRDTDTYTDRDKGKDTGQYTGTGSGHNTGQDLDLPAGPERSPDLALTHHPNQDQGQVVDLEMPEDPFPDWYSFTTLHEFPGTGARNQGWPPLEDPLPAGFPPRHA